MEELTNTVPIYSYLKNSFLEGRRFSSGKVQLLCVALI
jgi:hypothetical protein